MCLIEESVVEDHGHFGPRVVCHLQEFLPIPEVPDVDLGLPMTGHQRLLQEQPLGLEGEQGFGGFETILLPGQDEHRLGLASEQLIERRCDGDPELLADRFSPSPGP